MKFTTLFAATALAATLLGGAAQAEQAAFTSGTFAGASDHITTGNVTVIPHAGGGGVILLDAGFSLDGAPDPWVSIGSADADEPAVNVAELGDLNGQQAYIVPASVDLTDFDQVTIWCEQFSVPLGIAALN